MEYNLDKSVISGRHGIGNFDNILYSIQKRTRIGRIHYSARPVWISISCFCICNKHIPVLAYQSDQSISVIERTNKVNFRIHLQSIFQKRVSIHTENVFWAIATKWQWKQMIPLTPYIFFGK